MVSNNPVDGARRAMAKKLREYADNPCERGYVPVYPKTLRQVAYLLEGDLANAVRLTEKIVRT